MNLTGIIIHFFAVTNDTVLRIRSNGAEKGNRIALIALKILILCSIAVPTYCPYLDRGIRDGGVNGLFDAISEFRATADPTYRVTFRHFVYNYTLNRCPF